MHSWLTRSTPQCRKQIDSLRTWGRAASSRCVQRCRWQEYPRPKPHTACSHPALPEPLMIGKIEAQLHFGAQSHVSAPMLAALRRITRAVKASNSGCVTWRKISQQASRCRNSIRAPLAGSVKCGATTTKFCRSNQDRSPSSWSGSEAASSPSTRMALQPRPGHRCSGQQQRFSGTCTTDPDTLLNRPRLGFLAERNEAIGSI